MNNPEKNQNTLTLGHKRYGKTLCMTDISDVLFTGGFRSGKTESAIYYLSEVAKANDCRIVILSVKPDWRKFGKYIGSKKYTCNPLDERKINIFKAINGVELQDMSFVISELWCLYNRRPMSCAGIMAKAIYAAYKDAGVPYINEGEWTDEYIEKTKEVTFPKFYETLKTIVAEDDEDGQKLLKSITAFDNPNSFEYRILGSSEGLAIDEIIGGANEVTLFESHNLNLAFSQFLYGVMISGIYKRASVSSSCDFPKTILVIEEAHSILLSGKSTYEHENVFDKLAENSYTLGLYIFAIAYDPSNIPSVFVDTVPKHFELSSDTPGQGMCYWLEDEDGIRHSHRFKFDMLPDEE